MGLLSGMEEFGLNQFENADILEDIRPENKVSDLPKDDKRVPAFNEEEVLFDKHYTCPVCDLTFTARSVKTGKVRLKGQDMDLRPVYDKVDALKYDVIVCDKCGYSSLIRYFGKLTTKQAKDIKNTIGYNFKGIDNDKAVYTYNDAIARYKLALVTAVVKKAKAGEKGYICLKLSWIIRGKLKEKGLSPEERAKLSKEEMSYMENAYTAFLQALGNETLPIAGMDEHTLSYVLAYMAYRLGRIDEAYKLLGQVIMSKGANDRLKDKARDLKEIIKNKAVGQ